MYRFRLEMSLAAALVAGLSACAVTVDDNTNSVGDNADDVLDPDARSRLGDSRFVPWRKIRAERQAALDAYLAANADAFDAFRYRPAASSGIPTALLRNFSTVFPDIWGAPEENFGPQGFSANPFRSDNTLPFGLGLTVVNGLEVATVSCAGCHVGSVVGPEGNSIPLVGAPNTRANQFRTAIETTVADPRYLQAFGENALTVGVRDKVLARRRLVDNTLGAYTYNRARIPNAPDLNSTDKPGFMDAAGLVVSAFTLPELLDPAKAQQIIVAVMPPAPAEADIMSIWRQSARAVAHWDGTMRNGIYRNLGSQLGVAASQPAAVDFPTAKLTAPFVAELPPPPYPFDIDAGLALYGKGLYDKYCASCHSDGNSKIYPAAQVGTDPNRALQVTPENTRRLTAALRASCLEPGLCDIPNDDIFRDVDASGRGYAAHPLDGIWARAPYLHNGSVPTLHHLLVPQSRPATFFRGSLRYDQSKVGFVWDASAASDPYTHVFDTTLAGAARTGHDTAEFNGVDWSQRPRELAALLEYLKTL